MWFVSLALKQVSLSFKCRPLLSTSPKDVKIRKAPGAKEQVCLYPWAYSINHNENEDDNEIRSHRYEIVPLINLVVDMDISKVNIKSISVWWYLYVLYNT